MHKRRTGRPFLSFFFKEHMMQSDGLMALKNVKEKSTAPLELLCDGASEGPRLSDEAQSG